MVFDKDKIPDVFPSGGFGKGRRSSGPKLQIPAKSGILGLLAFIVIGIAAAMALTGKLGLVNISPEQAAVRVNYITGSTSPITRPGYQFYLPFVQEVFVLDKRPQNFVMSGREFRDRNHVPLLTVRANDGSNFRFDRLEIQYSIVPSAVEMVLEESGPGDSFKLEWIKGNARSILRDEFGRYSAEEIADPGKLQAAFAAAESRLREALEPYGLTILDIPQQRPNFDDEYERAIEERKVTDQDVERLIATEEQLRRERDQRLAAVERQKSIELEELRGHLDQERLEAEREKTQRVKSADAFRIQRETEGEAEKVEQLAIAGGLLEKYTKEAEGVLAQAQALEQRGEVVVREAIIQKLAGINFTMVPYSRDPAPKRLEYTDESERTPRIEDTSGAGGNQ